MIHICQSDQKSLVNAAMLAIQMIETSSKEDTAKAFEYLQNLCKVTHIFAVNVIGSTIGLELSKTNLFVQNELGKSIQDLINTPYIHTLTLSQVLSVLNKKNAIQYIGALIYYQPFMSDTTDLLKNVQDIPAFVATPKMPLLLADMIHCCEHTVYQENGYNLAHGFTS